MELGCTLMTLKSKSKICGIRTKSRMELGCTPMTLKSKTKWNAQKEQNGVAMCTYGSNEQKQGLWNA